MIFLLFSLVPRMPVYCVEEYVYYGVVPARLHRAVPKVLRHGAWDPTGGWKLDAESVKTEGLITIVGLEDDTSVKVYTLKDKALVSEAKLDEMEKHSVALPNGTIFKIVSDKLVYVLLLSGGLRNTETLEGPLPTGFHTGTDGSYVAKKFIFMASQDLGYYTTTEPYHIFALEPAEVTITRDDGVKQSFKLDANAHKALALKAFSVYRVESTGHIMIQSGETPGGTTGSGAKIECGHSFFIPSATGGFVGTRFYSLSRESWGVEEEYGFWISALEDAKVTIWNLEFKRVIQELEIKAGDQIRTKPRADGKEEVIAIESDKPITVSLIHSGDIKGYAWSYGMGVTFMGVKPNEETLFFLPTNSSVQTYIFAYEDTEVMIDDIPITIGADSYFLLTSVGPHKILSNKNIVVQLIHWPLIPPIQGIEMFGVAIPSIQSINVTPDVSLKPIAAEGFPTTYIIAGVAAAVVAVIVSLLAVKRRAK
jgi:hypothetical protein